MNLHQTLDRTAPLRTQQIMLLVLLALVPGLLLQVHFFGAGYVGNLLLAAAAALATEALVAWLRRLPLVASLSDGSALVTASLICLAMPPTVPGWILMLAVSLGLILGKAVFGGLGANPFNPAMVGYAMALVSYPEALAHWPGSSLDGLSGATALELVAHRQGQTLAELWATQPALGHWGGAGWEWINLGYLAGGLALVWRGLVDWRIPLALLLSLGLASALCYDSGSSASLGSPLFHWLSGGTLLAAFFVATDPTSCPRSSRARWLYGALIGGLIFLIRSFGAYPDGIAFAVLLGNACAPLLDQLLPRREAANSVAAP